jgi:hypothetical protein
MKMNKLLLITSILLLITISNASALIIESTTANDNNYQNGDLIIITIETNAENLDVNADLTSVDSNFNAQSVIVEEEGTTYIISYPITFSNTKADGTYNAIISLYDPVTSTTNSVTYGVQLTNTAIRSEDTQTITLNIELDSEITIEEGYIQICKGDSCETITEAEYEASRQIIITDGSVTLSNLTYNQLLDEISASANEQVKTEIQKYLSELVNVKIILEKQLYDMQELITQQANITNQTAHEANNILRKGQRNNIIIIIAVILLIGTFAYTIYLRTETTWFNRS